jgi:predicted metal-dependent hydrolase
MLKLCGMNLINLTLPQGIIQFERRVHKKRNLKLSIDISGSIVVSHPRFVSTKEIESFVTQRASWIFAKQAYFNSFDRSLLCKISNINYKEAKKEALMLLQNKVVFWNRVYQFDFKDVKVRNQKTKWGSCSKSKTLSFNYKLMFLDECLIDYVVVHEICHLKEFNHKKAFWDLVEKAIPDYKKIRQRLKKIAI